MFYITVPGADPGFQVRGGGALKKIAPNGGRRENFWGISCEKSRFYAKNRPPPPPPPPGSAPEYGKIQTGSRKVLEKQMQKSDQF